MIVSTIIKLIRFFFGLFIKPLIILGYQFYYRKVDKTRPLPQIKDPLLLLPASKLAVKIRNKEITSSQIVEIYINRIKEIQPILNCVVQTCYDEAIEEAKHVDEILSSETIDEKFSVKNAPLLGVPFSCKECISVKGMPNATGLISRKDFRSSENADVVVNLKNAGAILTCMTNTSELCMWLESSNYLYGQTNNPYNVSRIVGGSSGGEGSIIGGAGSVFGVGSDIGGSIRMPAFFNGVYGHKPSSYIISNESQFPPASGRRSDMLTTGPICRYASDLALMFKVFSGSKYDELADNFESNTNLKKLKYYYIKDMQGNMMTSDQSEDTKGAFEKAVKFLEKDLDVEMKEIHLPKLKSIIQIWTAGMGEGQNPDDFAKLLGTEKKPFNVITELAKSILGFQKTHTLPAIFLALVERFARDPTRHIQMGEKLKQELKIILGDDGVLLFPSFPTSAMYHNQPLFTNTFDYIYYGMFNFFGLPVTQCPMGLNKEGLPTGVQVVANHKCDHLTIRIAEHLESNLVGWIQPS